MKKREQNIYFKLIEDEDLFTEAFVNLLAFDSFRVAVIEFLRKQLDINDLDFDFVDIQTQCNKGKGIPDMIIETESFVIYIENKAKDDTPLTPNQPKFYLESLHKENRALKKFLVFLLPDGYSYIGVIEAFCDKHPECKVLYWSDFYIFLKEKEIAGSYQSNIAEEHFAKYLKTKFCPPEIEFSPKEVSMTCDKEIPIIMDKLASIVMGAKAIMNRRFSSGFDQRIVGREKDFEFYVNTKGDKLKLLRFGIRYNVWSNTKSPFVLVVINKEAWDKKKLEKIYGPDLGQSLGEDDKYDGYIYALRDDFITARDTKSIEKIIDLLSRIANDLVGQK